MLEIKSVKINVAAPANELAYAKQLTMITCWHRHRRRRCHHRRLRCDCLNFVHRYYRGRFCHMFGNACTIAKRISGAHCIRDGLAVVHCSVYRQLPLVLHRFPSVELSTRRSACSMYDIDLPVCEHAHTNTKRDVNKLQKLNWIWIAITNLSGLSMRPPCWRWQQIRTYSCNAVTLNSGFFKILLRYVSTNEIKTWECWKRIDFEFRSTISTIFTDQCLNDRHNGSTPKRIAAIDQFIRSPLESTLELHLLIDRPSLKLICTQNNQYRFFLKKNHHTLTISAFRSHFPVDPKSASAAVPQNVYPPWASWYGTPPMPPSYVWHDTIQSMVPRKSFSSISSVILTNLATAMAQ